jgi:5'-3' exonuclease
MGVPGFFVWLVKKYKNIIIYELDKETDILYLDANCLVHPQTQKVLKKYNDWKTRSYIEEKMLDEIEDYIEHLIEYTQPKKMVYIAIDGVAPCAKIKHQRMRRFKSIKYRSQINSLKRKHNLKIDNKWDNAAITPGTEFMQKITNRLTNFIKKEKYKHLQLIFSSGNTPGEGEHKILQHIYRLKKKYNIIIYGLDADLIYLALACKNNCDIYLLREVQHFGKNGVTLKESFTGYEELNYVDINNLRENLYCEITSKIDIEPEINNIINDFIFISYFMGNDFLPHIPSINIKQNGLDILLEAYVDTLDLLNAHFFNKEMKINNKFLLIFLKKLADQENDFFIKQYRKQYRPRHCYSNDKYEIDKFKLDTLQFPIYDPIKLGKGNPEIWKSKYYNHYFHTTSTDLICFEFLKGVLWTSNYYFKKCCSWSWYYPYEHAPMISDLYLYLKQHINVFDNINFTLDKPLKPFIQLLSVLHPSCNYLLPKQLRYLMTSPKSPIIDLYPFLFSEDLINKGLLWKCIPLLPPLNINKIQDTVSYQLLTNEDKLRNQKRSIYKNY